MTYQTTAIENFSARMPARGQVNSTTPFLSARKALGQVGQMFARAGEAMMNASSGALRVKRIEALQAKSDEQLAVMGIKRDEIVHYVFKDLYYV